MCGIWALFGITDEDILHHSIADCLKIAQRGPDATRIETIRDVPHSMLGFHRLEINDFTNGMQPMQLKAYPHITLICNGEIYNAFALRDSYGLKFESSCDTEAIIHLYERFGAEKTAAMLDGVFAFVIVDTQQQRVHLGRDLYGVRPLFTFFKEGSLGVCSEAKGIQDIAKHKNATIKTATGPLGTGFVWCAAFVHLFQRRFVVAASCGNHKLTMTDLHTTILYIISSSHNYLCSLGVCSEAKGIQDIAKHKNATINPFPPGYVQTYEVSSEGEVSFLSEKQAVAIGDPDTTGQGVTLSSSTHENVHALLKEAVKKRLIGGRRIGCLLSGGLDSSLIASLVVECIRDNRNGCTYNGDQVQTFSIGMEGSPDIEYGRLAAQYLKTDHHEVLFTPEEGFKAIRDVIYCLESYDITTIRASVGMYLVSKYVSENTDTAILFSGEGADELCQGYIYFHKAPTPQDADEESRRLLKDLYLYDNLRADRTTAVHGLELRVPFLDKTFTSYYLSLSPEERQPRDGVEKYLLRKSFSDSGILPDAVLWRPKEAFSDGVSSKEKSWFEHLHDLIKEKITDSMMLEASERFKGVVPHTKEAYYYRLVFEELFPRQHSLIPYYWLPKWSDVTEPSARVLAHYK